MRPSRASTRRGPLVGERLQLAVAVELVAEEVAEHDQARVELGGHLRQPRLVDLEEALGAPLLEQGRGDAPGHVRAGPVVHGPAAGGVRGSRRACPRSWSCRWWR